MKITQFEQSGFIFESNNGFKLAIDIAVCTPIDKLEGIKVDAVIISHFHSDHFSVEYIAKLNPAKVYLSQECIDKIEPGSLTNEIVTISTKEPVSIADFEVLIFDVDHGPNATARPKENFGFLFKVDGETILFAGDMYHASGIEVFDLEVDKLLVPVGGFYTFGPEEALEYVNQFKQVGEVIPMHYELNPVAKEKFNSLYLK